MKTRGLRNTGFMAAMALAAMGWLGAPTTSHASLIFDFSFTESGVETVTGEIDGLTNGTNAASHVIIDTFTGITPPFTLPFDTTPDATSNLFTVDFNQITSADYTAMGPFPSWSVEIGTVGGTLENTATGATINGPITFAEVQVVEPSTLAVLGTLVGLFLLRFARAKRRDRQIRPHQPATA